MSSERRILDLLKSAELTRINFRIGDSMVYGMGFRRIANLIQQDRITIRPRSPQEDRDADANGVEAEYNYATNTIVIPRGDRWPQLLWDRGIMVHEAVHIMQDRHQGQSRLAHVEEMAGFIASCWYLRMHTASLETATRGLRMLDHARQAYRIAWDAAEMVENTAGFYEVPAKFSTEMRPHILALYAGRMDAHTTNRSSGI